MATIYATDRLVVRDWTQEPADLDRVFDMYSRPEVVRFLNVPLFPLRDRAGAAETVRRWQARNAIFGAGYGIWAVQRRDNDLVVGTTMLKPLPGTDEAKLTDDIEVGWHLHPDSWGQGYATEAARGAIERGFALGVDEIYAVVSPGNEASMRVARRIGMTAIGRRTSWYGGEELETFVLRRPCRISDSGRDS
ncbi:GNAT family N-acetyltransferase [Micromonospora sp. HM5-17]|jgi:RimJ/RimL family protein N-acetyltransferase|uniref:GNAT family N-acetyltransferase n=1 Tax=Micromonospora sp. HM5-17 TaxID=2487710 RepID=UPI000F49E780|nr:GNAT family N-acetyltransferase [Micromonospora sp. HM5-17]ROT32759.1 N-acetyltransferase [Micromonospora sp. HM5-17]